MRSNSNLRRSLILTFAFALLFGLVGAQVAASMPEMPNYGALTTYITVADADNVPVMGSDDEALRIVDTDTQSVVGSSDSLVPYAGARYDMAVTVADSDGVDDITAVRFIFSHTDSSDAFEALSDTLFANAAFNETQADGDAFCIDWVNTEGGVFETRFETGVDGSDTTYAAHSPSATASKDVGTDTEDTQVSFSIPFAISKVAPNSGYWFCAVAVYKDDAIVASALRGTYTVAFYGEVAVPVSDPGPTILSWYDVPAGLSHTDEASLKTLTGFRYITNGPYSRKAATTTTWLDSVDNQDGSKTHTYASYSAELPDHTGFVGLQDNQFRFRIADTEGTYLGGAWIGEALQYNGEIYGFSAGSYKDMDAGTTELGEAGGCRIWLELADVFEDNAAFQGVLYFYVGNHFSMQ